MSELQELLNRGERDHARAAASKVLASKPTDGEALSTLARLELEESNVDAARLLLARVGPKDRRTYEVLLAEAMVQQLSGEPDAARLVFAELTGAFPSRSEAFFALGVSLLDKLDAKGAEKSLGKAVELQPKHFLYRYRHAEAIAQLGQFDVAAKELIATIELRPDFVPAYLALARLLEANGQRERALEIVKGGLIAMPTERRLIAEQVRLHLGSGDGAAALASGAVASGGTVGVIEELMRAKALDAALTLIATLQTDGKGSAKVSLLKGLAFEQSGRTPQALEAYREAMALDPKDWSAANNRGLLLLEDFQDDASKLAEARADLTEAVRRAEGKVPDPLLNLALFYGRQESWAEAIALVQQVIAHPAVGVLKPQAEKMLSSLQKAASAA